MNDGGDLAILVRVDRLFTSMVSLLLYRSDFGKMVAKEYLRFFEFEKMSLVESLRQFLSCFSLTGESQERERVIVHFSDRYHECNPDVYHSVGESLCSTPCYS